MSRTFSKIFGLGEKIKYLRIKNGLKQKDLALKAGISQEHISKIEAGGNISETTLLKIANALMVDINYFIAADNQKSEFNELALKEKKFYFRVAQKVLIDGVGPTIHKELKIEVPLMFFALPEGYGNGVEKVVEGKTVKLVCRNCNSDPIHEPNGVYSTLNIILSEEKDNSKEVWKSIKKDDFYARYDKNGKITNDYAVDMILDYRLARKLVRRLFDYFFVSINLITKL